MDCGRNFGPPVNFFLTIAATFLLASTAHARRTLAWTYQQLYDAAELVAIGKPIATTDTEERDVLPNMFPAIPVVGLSTEFELGVVMKGGESAGKIVLHHDRLLDTEARFKNGPGLVAFDPGTDVSYLLFLKREADGRYSRVSGQTDPAQISIQRTDGAIFYQVHGKKIPAKGP